MEFITVLGSMLTMLAFMAMGWALVRFKAARTQDGKTLSSFLLYFATPGMLISSFQDMTYTSQSALSLLKFFLISLLVQLLMFAAMRIAFASRIRQGGYRILTIGSFMGNVGFFGQPVILALFPDRPIAACYCMAFAASMNLLIFTLGEYMISGDRRYVSVRRAILNPTILALFFAIPMYVLGIRLPHGVYNVFAILRTMSGPVCMFLLGLRLASMSFREIFAEPLAYSVGVLKLLVFPLLAYGVSLLFPDLDSTFRLTLLITAGTPCASMILALAEVHNCEQEKAAYSVLMSSILCVFTIPLLTLVFAGRA